MMQQTEEAIRDDIFEAITRLFGYKITSYETIPAGYLNYKWQIVTDEGIFFVKQYNRTRYPLHMMHALEQSLQYQMLLRQQHFLCPTVLSKHGQYVLQSANGERFMLTNFVAGETIAAGTATPLQMYSLGQQVGRMHQLLDCLTVGTQPLHWDILSKPAMLASWQKRWDEAQLLHCDATLTHLQRQQAILAKNDTQLFAACEAKLCHWDLFYDNILFVDEHVSAIVDFDRMHVVYRDFDIARPLLSYCLFQQTFNYATAAAFVEGYREHKPLTSQQFVRAIQLTWWREATWVRATATPFSRAMTRFIEENEWISTHWDTLAEQFVL